MVKIFRAAAALGWIWVVFSTAYVVMTHGHGTERVVLLVLVAFVGIILYFPCRFIWDTAPVLQKHLDEQKKKQTGK